MSTGLGANLADLSDELKLELERLITRESEINDQMQKAKEDMKARVESSLQQCSHKIYRCDFHAHSTYSDGKSNVDEIHEWMVYSGIDFMVITDHGTLSQRVDCMKYPDMWYGEESTNGHHIVALDIPRELDPADDLQGAVNKVRELGGFPIVAHPCGWYKHPYPPGLADELDGLDGKYAIEIGNGAENIFDYFDETDQKAVMLWDRLLSQGKEVVGLGNTDEHHCYQIGILWNGVICSAPAKEEIMEAMREGHLFVSNGPVIILKTEQGIMGDTIYVEQEKSLTFEVECHDAHGIYQIKVIKDAGVFKKFTFQGEESITLQFEDLFSKNYGYYRAECYTLDGRRAYSNPIRVMKE
ncbi:MAG TPA: hypothetical protein EYP53_05975 [Candidatus Latescibacteria bacterium]|nr:hypothetical protein [Candidatus Latescibacterota bacterium]